MENNAELTLGARTPLEADENHPSEEDTIAPLEAEQSVDSSVLISEPLVEKSIHPNEFEEVASLLEDALPEKGVISTYAFPNARQWLGPRFFAAWTFPIIGIRRIRRFIYSVFIFICED